MKRISKISHTDDALFMEVEQDESKLVFNIESTHSNCYRHLLYEEYNRMHESDDTISQNKYCISLSYLSLRQHQTYSYNQPASDVNLARNKLHHSFVVVRQRSTIWVVVVDVRCRSRRTAGRRRC